MPAERQEQVIRYTPRPSSAPDERDLILLEQEKWGGYCGLLTRGGLAKYLRQYFFGGQRPADEESESVVNCCGYGGPLAIAIYVYELKPGVSYSLRTTVGELGAGVLETIIERESVTFNMEKTASIRHPAAAVRAARWLTGPWTTGGADVAAPALSVSGREVVSPIPLFGTAELALETRRWRHVLSIPKDDAEALLQSGWAEFVVGLPSGGRPVGLEVTEPPGSEELAKTGVGCGRGRGGVSGHIESPEEDEPTAQPEDKHIHCEYCEGTCDDPDKEGGR